VNIFFGGRSTVMEHIMLEMADGADEQKKLNESG